MTWICWVSNPDLEIYKLPMGRWMVLTYIWMYFSVFTFTNWFWTRGRCEQSNFNIQFSNLVMSLSPNMLWLYWISMFDFKTYKMSLDPTIIKSQWSIFKFTNYSLIKLIWANVISIVVFQRYIVFLDPTM